MLHNHENDVGKYQKHCQAALGTMWRFVVMHSKDGCYIYQKKKKKKKKKKAVNHTYTQTQ
jgi:hypothetical protein